MKKIKFLEKLKLNKTIVSELNAKDSSNIRGGVRKTLTYVCIKTALDTICWCGMTEDIKCFETKRDLCDTPPKITKPDCK